MMEYFMPLVNGQCESPVQCCAPRRGSKVRVMRRAAESADCDAGKTEPQRSHAPGQARMVIVSYSAIQTVRILSIHRLTGCSSPT